MISIRGFRVTLRAKGLINFNRLIPVEIRKCESLFFGCYHCFLVFAFFSPSLSYFMPSLVFFTLIANEISLPTLATVTSSLFRFLQSSITLHSLSPESFIMLARRRSAAGKAIASSGMTIITVSPSIYIRDKENKTSLIPIDRKSVV